MNQIIRFWFFFLFFSLFFSHFFSFCFRRKKTIITLIDRWIDCSCFSLYFFSIMVSNDFLLLLSCVWFNAKLYCVCVFLCVAQLGHLFDILELNENVYIEMTFDYWKQKKKWKKSSNVTVLFLFSFCLIVSYWSIEIELGQIPFFSKKKFSVHYDYDDLCCLCVFSTRSNTHTQAILSLLYWVHSQWTNIPFWSFWWWSTSFNRKQIENHKAK